jgi:hypothetical protein
MQRSIAHEIPLRYFCIILKFHRTLLRPLITTKIERIPPPLWKRGARRDLRGYPPEKSPSIPLFQRGKYHFHIWDERI